IRLDQHSIDRLVVGPVASARKFEPNVEPVKSKPTRRTTLNSLVSPLFSSAFQPASHNLLLLLTHSVQL
ncbi:hypothetical protein Pfo_017055, partial [Paulownia fortunei]